MAIINFDKIEKLIKLANGTPYEPEANTAARKVCELLKDHKFATQPAQNKYQPSPPPSPPKQNPASYQSADQFWRDWFKDVGDINRGHWGSRSDEPFWKSTPPNRDRTKPPKAKRPLKCTQCKNDIETAFMGHEATFVCNTCVWENYRKTL